MPFIFKERHMNQPHPHAGSDNKERDMNQPHPRTGSDKKQRRWFNEFPDPMVLIFMVLVAVYLLTFIIPAGEFARELVDGRNRVIPDSFQLLAETAPLHFFDLFLAIPQGMINASPFLFIEIGRASCRESVQFMQCTFWSKKEM